MGTSVVYPRQRVLPQVKGKNRVRDESEKK